MKSRGLGRLGTRTAPRGQRKNYRLEARTPHACGRVPPSRRQAGSATPPSAALGRHDQRLDTRLPRGPEQGQPGSACRQLQRPRGGGGAGGGKAGPPNPWPSPERSGGGTSERAEPPISRPHRAVTVKSSRRAASERATCCPVLVRAPTTSTRRGARIASQMKVPSQPCSPCANMRGKKNDRSLANGRCAVGVR